MSTHTDNNSADDAGDGYGDDYGNDYGGGWGGRQDHDYGDGCLTGLRCGDGVGGAHDLNKCHEGWDE